MEQVLTAVTDALSDSPSLALWVLVIIYGYKAVVVGSIYGVIRYCVEKAHSAYVTPEHKRQVVDIEARLRSTVISNCHEDLIAQIERLRCISIKGVSAQYIHSSDIVWLREAIDAKLRAEAEKDLLKCK